VADNDTRTAAERVIHDHGEVSPSHAHVIATALAEAGLLVGRSSDDTDRAVLDAEVIAAADRVEEGWPRVGHHARLMRLLAAVRARRAALTEIGDAT
jgi:hypothetical protein